jgi:tetrapyrrole methylase family protein / MazG family protein
MMDHQKPSDENKFGITIIGLGTGTPEGMTRQAWEWLVGAGKVLVREGVDLSGLPEVAAKAVRLAPGEDGIKRIFALVKENSGITYVAPGAPVDTDPLARQIRARASEEGVKIRLVPGMSLFDAAQEAVSGIDGQGAVRVGAEALAGLYAPPFPPSMIAMIAGIGDAEVAGGLREMLGQVYPGQTVLKKVAPGKGLIDVIPLSQMGGQADYSPDEIWVLPSLGRGTSLEDFHEIVAHLRAPNGCPWDREQTHTSLRKHLLEETYETLEALDSEDVPGMVEEFGDLLLQIALHAQIATEAGEYRMPQVIQGINDKIVRRHPHVFGEAQVEGVKGVLQNWERLKAEERGNGHREKQKGLLDGVPTVFPSLAQAQEIQDRAARVGFDWKELSGVIDKVIEELEEVKAAEGTEAKTAEIGDLLFAAVNLARWEKVDAESALRATNARFRRRFAHIEQAAIDKNILLDELGFDEMNRLWEEAKGRMKDEG